MTEKQDSAMDRLFSIETLEHYANKDNKKNWSARKELARQLLDTMRQLSLAKTQFQALSEKELEIRRENEKLWEFVFLIATGDNGHGKRKAKEFLEQRNKDTDTKPFIDGYSGSDC